MRGGGTVRAYKLKLRLLREFTVGRGVEGLDRADGAQLREWREIWTLGAAMRRTRIVQHRAICSVAVEAD